MRLPLRSNDPADIDLETAVSMIRYAINNGVNYVDTAYLYHKGMSEIVLGKALRDGYRERVAIADKMPCWMIEQPGDLDRVFEEQKERLGVDKIDFYLLHALNRNTWKKIRGMGVLDWAEKKRAAGEIDWFGFSFHDDASTFMGIVDYYPDWDFCQIQYNIMDVERQATRAGLLYAYDRGLGVIVMEPLRGGDILRNVPPSINALWAEKPPLVPADTAFRWLWDQKEVGLVLSGMTTMDNVVQNIGTAADARIGAMDKATHQRIARIRETYLGLKPIPCTACNYCADCPRAIPVPRLFDIYNEHSLYKNDFVARFMLSTIPSEKKPDHCAKCGRCEGLCPQGIDIPSELTKIDAFIRQLEQDNPA